MQLLPPSNPNASPTEKILRWLPFIGIGIAVFIFWGTIAPFIAATLKSTFWIVMYSAFFLFIWIKWKWLSMSYKGIFNKITNFFIKYDPLMYMDQYVEKLRSTLTKINKIRVSLHGEKKNLQRIIKEQQDIITENLKAGAAAKQANLKNQVTLAGNRARGAQESINLYMPDLERMTRSLDILDQLAENWDLAATTMAEENERMRTRFRILKKNADVLKMGDAFMKGQTEEGRVYQVAIAAYHETVSERMAYIEDFEKNARPMLEGAQLHKTMRENEGIDMIERYMQDGKLMLPDFSNFNDNVVDTQVIEASPYSL
jgi:phage shock protein A